MASQQSFVARFDLAALALLVVSSCLWTGVAVAGEAERNAALTCAATTKNPKGAAICTVAAVTTRELDLCLQGSPECFGKNNELRKLACAAGIGCDKPYVNNLAKIIEYEGGCFTVFEKRGTYWYDRCEDIQEGGAGGCEVGPGAVDNLKFLVPFKGDLIAVWSRGSTDGIYRAEQPCGIAGKPEFGGRVVYDADFGGSVTNMSVTNRGELRTEFKSGCYLDPEGECPGGCNPPRQGYPVVRVCDD